MARSEAVFLPLNRTEYPGVLQKGHRGVSLGSGAFTRRKHSVHMELAQHLLRFRQG